MGRVKRIAVRLGVGAALTGLAFMVDRPAFVVLRTITLYDHWGEMREGLTAAKFLGSGLGTLVVGLVVWRLDCRGWRRALALWLIVLAAGAGGAVLKGLTGRERPSHLDQPVGGERIAFHGPARGLAEAPFQSFPSGHTLGAFASATVLAAYYPPAGPVVYAVAGASGVNRVVKHQHFLSDVVAGAVLGHVIALWLLTVPGLRRLWAHSGTEPP
jgi:membrane-associated phospholipid phosphatase